MKPIKLYEEFHQHKKHYQILGQNPGIFGLAQYCYNNWGPITGEPHENRDDKGALDHPAIQDIANYYQVDTDDFKSAYNDVAQGNVTGNAGVPASTGAAATAAGSSAAVGSTGSAS
jgi:hypothetical protein